MSDSQFLGLLVGTLAFFWGIPFWALTQALKSYSQLLGRPYR